MSNWSKANRAEEVAQIIQELGGRTVSIYKVIEEAERKHDVSPTEVEEAIEEALMDGLVHHSGTRVKISSSP